MRSRHFLFVMGVCVLSGLSAVNAYPRIKDFAKGVVTGVDTATQFPDGSILTVGPNGANIYDPRTDKWSASNRGLDRKFAHHAATLFPNDDVIVSGGMQVAGKSCMMLTSFYRYSRSRNIWNKFGRLNHPRMHHSATLLHNNLLLLIGGGTGYCSSDLYDESNEVSAEICDIQLGDCMDVSAPKFARSFHSAALISEQRVVVVGGESLGGHRDRSIPVELFNPKTNQWTIVPDIEIGGPAATITALNNGWLLFIGANIGQTNSQSQNRLGSAAVYDSDLKLIRQFPSSSLPFTGHAVVSLPEHRIAVIGGVMEGPGMHTVSFLNKSLIVNINNLSSSTNFRLQYMIQGHSAFYIGKDTIAILGGFNPHNVLMPRMQKYRLTK